MKTRYALIVCAGLVSLLFGADVTQKKSKMERLGQMKVDAVTTEDGFEYFSGYLDTKDIPNNFLTVYSFQNNGDVPKLKIIGHNINVDFPVSRIDHALEVYKLLVQQKVSNDATERDRISKELDRYLKDK